MQEGKTSPDAAAQDGTSGDSTKDAEEPIGFSEAMGQLEEILGRIEAETIDIDDLAKELRRATELLDVCRGKIRRAEAEVEQIMGRLEPG